MKAEDKAKIRESLDRLEYLPFATIEIAGKARQIIDETLALLAIEDKSSSPKLDKQAVISWAHAYGCTDSAVADLLRQAEQYEDKPKRSLTEAFAEIRREYGAEFDKLDVNAFMREVRGDPLYDLARRMAEALREARDGGPGAETALDLCTEWDMLDAAHDMTEWKRIHAEDKPSVPREMVRQLARPQPESVKDDRPVVVEAFADNGAHSHWKIIERATGEIIASWPTEESATDHVPDAGEMVATDARPLGKSSDWPGDITSAKDLGFVLDDIASVDEETGKPYLPIIQAVALIQKHDESRLVSARASSAEEPATADGFQAMTARHLRELKTMVARLEEVRALDQSEGKA